MRADTSLTSAGLRVNSVWISGVPIGGSIEVITDWGKAKRLRELVEIRSERDIERAAELLEATETRKKRPSMTVNLYSTPKRSSKGHVHTWKLRTTADVMRRVKGSRTALAVDRDLLLDETNNRRIGPRYNIRLFTPAEVAGRPENVGLLPAVAPIITAGPHATFAGAARRLERITLGGLQAGDRVVVHCVSGCPRKTPPPFEGGPSELDKLDAWLKKAAIDPSRKNVQVDVIRGGRLHTQIQRAFVSERNSRGGYNRAAAVTRHCRSYVPTVGARAEWYCQTAS